MKAFEALVPQRPDVTLRPMFGCPTAFARGAMFMGVFGDDLYVRLPQDLREAALRLPGARLFEPMPGRPMREYVVLPPSERANRRKAAPWVEASLAYATSLPVKAKGGASGKARRRSR